jgi:hypothetical protein
MKLKSLSCFVAVPLLMWKLSAQAHDPKEHIKDAEKPNCAALKNMNHFKMDRNDPVMKAMMQKCMAAMHHDAAESDHAHGGQGKQDKKCPEKVAGHEHHKPDEPCEAHKPPKHQHSNW